MKEVRPKIVYRFMRQDGGNWKYINDKNGIPISITTDKHPNSVTHIFARKYPSFASMYQLGETLVAVPDQEATKRVADVEQQRREELDNKVQDMWWNK